MKTSSSMQNRVDLPTNSQLPSKTTALNMARETLLVALVGAPNTGKSTLFNALTGSRVTMGNWPGTTVEVTSGRWALDVNDNDRLPGELTINPHELELLDLPGAYGLDAQSPDEELTEQLLTGEPAASRPSLCIVTLDATRPAQCLYLVSQLRELAIRVVVVVTMSDVAAKRGSNLDLKALSDAIGCPVVMTDPRSRMGLASLESIVRTSLASPCPLPRLTPDSDDPTCLDDARYSWLSSALADATSSSGPDQISLSDKIDRWATAPLAGPLLFLAVMWLVFQLTTAIAAPLQAGLGDFFAGPVCDLVTSLLTLANLQGSWLEGLLINGLIAGVGMLLTFVPLMALMFCLLALLEDSGYLARAAVVMDRVMRTIGLPGQAFLPLVVGFGCNVPAVSATRILPDTRMRLLTVLLVPFTACTARLTVFVMLGTVFFKSYAGTAVFLMYVASVAMLVVVGLILRRTLWRTMGAEPLVIDLPAYHVPTLRLILVVVWQRLQGFLKTASGIIVVTVCAVWLLQSIPTTSDHVFGHVPIADSAYGVMAHAIAPVFAPAGFAQWQTASALIVGFVAKEAVITSWAQAYASAEPGTGQLVLFEDQLRLSFEQSSGGHPLAAVVAFMAFLLVYTPCVATLAAQKREAGLRWTLFGVAMQLAVAWLLAVAVFQVGRLVL